MEGIAARLRGVKRRQLTADAAIPTGGRPAGLEASAPDMARQLPLTPDYGRSFTCNPSVGVIGEGRPGGVQNVLLTPRGTPGPIGDTVSAGQYESYWSQLEEMGVASSPLTSPVAEGAVPRDPVPTGIKGSVAFSSTTVSGAGAQLPVVHSRSEVLDSGEGVSEFGRLAEQTLDALRSLSVSPKLGQAERGGGAVTGVRSNVNTSVRSSHVPSTARDSSLWGGSISRIDNSEIRPFDSEDPSRVIINSVLEVGPVADDSLTVVMESDLAADHTRLGSQLDVPRLNQAQADRLRSWKRVQLDRLAREREELDELRVSNTLSFAKDLEELRIARLAAADEMKAHRALIDEQKIAWDRECERISRQSSRLTQLEDELLRRETRLSAQERRLDEAITAFSVDREAFKAERLAFRREVESREGHAVGSDGRSMSQIPESTVHTLSRDSARQPGDRHAVFTGLPGASNSGIYPTGGASSTREGCPGQQRGFVQDSVYIGKSARREDIHVSNSHPQPGVGGVDALGAPTPVLPAGRQFSEEERRLIRLHPAIADVIREPASIGGGAGWESFNRDIVELDTNVLRNPVVGSARVPTSRPKPFTGIDQDWNTWWRDFTLDMRANMWDERVALNQLLPLLRRGPAQDCVDAWQRRGLTTLRELLPLLSYKFRTEDPLARWNIWRKRVQTPRDGSYRAYGLQLQVDGREAAKGTGLSERAIENEIVERFVLSLRDPGEQRAAFDRWRPGKSSLEEMLGVVDDYCAKAMRAIRPAPVEAVRLESEESDEEYEVEVAAFTAPRLDRTMNRGGKFPTARGSFRPPPITKDLVKGWVKEMVTEQRPGSTRSRELPGASGVSARRRVMKKVDRARDHECGRCFAFGHWPVQCTGVKRSLEEAILAGDREGRDNSGADKERLGRLRRERDARRKQQGNA